MSEKKILNTKSIKFLEKYLNNPSPTGYEWEGQKIWMDYLKPYVDEFITDTYGTAVGVINPNAKFKVNMTFSKINEIELYQVNDHKLEQPIKWKIEELNCETEFLK